MLSGQNRYLENNNMHLSGQELQKVLKLALALIYKIILIAYKSTLRYCLT